MSQTAPPEAERFHLLDLSRALAALLVVLSHYSHFYHLPGTGAGAVGNQPGYAVLAPLYDRGGYAVQYFFVLSGVIFFWFYGRAIAPGKAGQCAVGAREFLVLRFYRLYPLHVATLAVVALSFPVFHRFERPIQSWLRRRLLPSPAFPTPSIRKSLP